MINNTQVRNLATISQSSPYNRLNMNSLFENRDVQRAGWLNYIPFAGTNPPSDDSHKFWVVFAVYGNQTPYLEFYQQRQSNQTNPIQHDGPVSKHSLLNCRHITAVIEESLQHPQQQKTERYFEFSIMLDTHVIRLAATNDEVMWDWISCLRTKLISMDILRPMENLYSQNPESSSVRRNNLHYLAAFSLNNHNQNDHNNQNDVNTQLPLHTHNSDDLYEPIFNLAESVQRISLAQNTPDEEGPPPYERIFNINTNNNNNNNNNNTNPADMPRASFREAQVEKFKKEMEQLNGLTLKVRKKDCYNAIAFVDIQTFGTFVAGWKQKDHPYLHNTFHIGDQLVSINGQMIESAGHAKQFIKQASPYLDIVIRRVPFGQIFCLKKSFDGEELGLVREKGTAQINFIQPGSVASKAGMQSKCSFYNDYGNDIIRVANLLSNSQQPQPLEQNWFITEINNRPMNLFLKNDEIADRLNAIGKEISILVQPVDFIKRLKKQFKMLKNYKDFIVQ